MRAPAVSFAQKIAAAVLAALMTFTLVPLAHADGEGSSAVEGEAVASGLPDQLNDSADSSGESQEVSAEQDAEGSSVAPMLASGLAGKPNSFVNSDVALDSEPVIGSFTVDGLTFAVIDESHVELVGVAPSVILSGGSEAAGPSVTLSGAAEGGVVEGSNESNASEAGVTNLPLPEIVTYEGATYTLTSIAPYAFYLSGVTDLTLPASVSDVDDRAFRSSDVANVEVADDNPAYSSFDGALYDAEQLSLLLIPEGKQGTVRIPKTTETVEASVFSHCPLVDSISVDAGSAAFASENGLLYTSDLTTLLRVPAGATEVTIREGCITIAAGVFEACTSLTTINAPATVTTISPDVFHAIPTVSLPAASLTESAPQLTAMVALTSVEDGISEIKSEEIEVRIADVSFSAPWENRGFLVTSAVFKASLGVSTLSAANAAVCALNLNTVTAWCHQRGRSDMLDASNTYVNGLSVGGGSRRSLISLNGQISASMALGGLADYMHINPEDPTSGYSWYVTQWPAGSLPPVSNIFLIYHETDAKTVVSKAKSPVPSNIYLYNANSPVINLGISWDAKGGACGTTYSTVPAMKKASSPVPTKTGYTCTGWYVAPGLPFAGQKVCDAGANTGLIVESRTLEARWAANPYTIAFDSQGGPTVPSISATYDQDVTLPAPGARNGYRFTGWNTKADGSGTAYQAGIALTKPNLATSGTAKLFAQWDATISALVPLDVEAQVDVLGLEAPKEAQGYIESRCGEPLKVARVDLTPLDGAKGLFGAGNVADVFLEVLANDGTSPSVRFSLEASATESDASKLQAFTMGSYGAKVPISYRFAMPPEVQTSLVEYADPTPVCSVAYTVALA